MSALVHPSVSLIPAAPPPPIATVEAPADPEDGGLLCAALTRPRSVAITGLLLAIATALATLGSPAIAACIGMLAPALYVGLVTRSLGDPALAQEVYGPLGPPLRTQVVVAELRPAEFRAAYERLLQGHERLRRALRSAPLAAAALADVYLRCGELVHAAGRLARMAGPLHAQLDHRSARQLVEDVADLSSRSMMTDDASAASAFRRAAAIRGRQAATTHQLEELCDRLAARLALAEAVIDSVTATAVKMDAAERESAGLDAPLADQVDDLRGELDRLDAELDATWARPGSPDPRPTSRSAETS